MQNVYLQSAIIVTQLATWPKGPLVETFIVGHWLLQTWWLLKEPFVSKNSSSTRKIGGGTSVATAVPLSAYSPSPKCIAKASFCKLPSALWLIPLQVTDYEVMLLRVHNLQFRHNDEISQGAFWRNDETLALDETHSPFCSGVRVAPVGLCHTVCGYLRGQFFLCPLQDGGVKTFSTKKGTQFMNWF